MSEIPTGAREALLSYQQADEDGVMVLTSRQAIHEVVDGIDAQAARIAELERERDEQFRCADEWAERAANEMARAEAAEARIAELEHHIQVRTKMCADTRVLLHVAEAERDRLLAVLAEIKPIIDRIAERVVPAALTPAPQEPCPTCGGDRYIGRLEEREYDDRICIRIPCPDCQEKPHG